MEQILFSCVGTTDPARGEHDGGLMHIMRHYRPKAVCIFLTPEIAKLDQTDSRYDKMLTHIQKNWNGYTPDFIRIQEDIQDASDLDELSEPLTNAVARFSAQYPDAEILVNISSGTPQMQMILSQLLLDLRYRTRGIQIKNFERKAGTTIRSNAKAYDVEMELELAELEENEPGAPNRCVEPELFAMRRQAQWLQVEALLRRRDYSAIAAMKNCLPTPLMKLVKHLNERNNLNHQQAQKYAKELSLGFDLYPQKKGVQSVSGYGQVSEYFLMIKNFQVAGRYTDFVLRLNPFTIRLQESFLGILLQKKYHLSIHDLFLSTGHGKYQRLCAEKVQNYLPEISSRINQTLLERTGKPLQDIAPSIFIYNLFLDELTGEDDETCTEEEKESFAKLTELFDKCEKLNSEYRNIAAHDLVHLTDQQIEASIQLNSAALVRQIEKAMQIIYPQCDPALFNIYEKCNRYIAEHH